MEIDSKMSLDRPRLVSMTCYVIVATSKMPNYWIVGIFGSSRPYKSDHILIFTPAVILEQEDTIDHFYGLLSEIVLLIYTLAGTLALEGSLLETDQLEVSTVLTIGLCSARPVHLYTWASEQIARLTHESTKWDGIVSALSTGQSHSELLPSYD